ncbi:MAG: IS3 family transposase [Streptosporangiales bacterium]|nr:IS3 family transposase [Streptosporangiales bacterium]
MSIANRPLQDRREASNHGVLVGVPGSLSGGVVDELADLIKDRGEGARQDFDQLGAALRRQPHSVHPAGERGVASQRTSHGVPHALSCRALEVPQSWCFARRRDRRPTSRQTRRIQLAAEVRRVFDDSAGTYGSPRITAELRAAGWRVSAKTRRR